MQNVATSIFHRVLYSREFTTYTLLTFPLPREPPHFHSLFFMARRQSVRISSCPFTLVFFISFFFLLFHFIPVFILILVTAQLLELAALRVYARFVLSDKRISVRRDRYPDWDYLIRTKKTGGRVIGSPIGATRR